MAEEYSITDSHQYHILKKALLQYELLQKAELKNIAGTHWRKKIINNTTDDHVGYVYYFVMQNSMDGGSVFTIRMFFDHSFDTIFPNDSISDLMYAKKQEELEKITIEQFQEETKTVLEQYGLMWKK